MADRRGVLIPLLILAFIFFSPAPSRTATTRFEFDRTNKDVIAEEWRSLDAISRSTFGQIENDQEGVINLTGLELDRGYAWTHLSLVKEKAREHLKYALGDEGLQTLQGDEETNELETLLYNNVTGLIMGKWTSPKLPEAIAIPQLNLSRYSPLGPFGRFPPRPFGRNITGSGGGLRIELRERARSEDFPVDNTLHVTDLSAEIVIEDSANSMEWPLQTYGVYFTDLGSAILTTTSDKFAGIFALPQLALSNRTFELSRTYLNESLFRTIQQQQDGKIEYLNPWSSLIDKNIDPSYAPAECEIIVYLQQLLPISSKFSLSTEFLTMIERESRFPTGAFIPAAPRLHFSALVFSPDCGFVLESQGPPDHIPQDGDHLIGRKTEALHNHARYHLLIFTFVTFAQMTLLIRQMREASTPSTRSKLSFSTIALLGLGDGFATMSLLLVSLFVASLWVSFMSAAFLSFISVSFFGMRFLMDIWSAQAPERERRARELAEQERDREAQLTAALDRARAEQTATADSAPTDNTTPSRPNLERLTPDTLPLPATARMPIDTGASPIFLPSDQDEWEPNAQATTTATPNAAATTMVTFGALYTRFYLFLFIALAASVNATSWPKPLRKGYFSLQALIYFSFWIPQIVRNVQRNCRHALNWEFVFGQSSLRLLPFAYFFGYSDNVLLVENDLQTLAALAIWVWLQVIILVSQEIIGPRWFIRKDWAPPAYDYHPVLREDEEGATMPIGFSESQSVVSAPTTPLLERRPSLQFQRRGSTFKETRNKGKRVFDCAICMQELEVPVVESGSTQDSTLAANLLARRTYMVTPCRHIFHSACLEGWTKYRLQCPICRETLPPL